MNILACFLLFCGFLYGGCEAKKGITVQHPLNGNKVCLKILQDPPQTKMYPKKFRILSKNVQQSRTEGNSSKINLMGLESSRVSGSGQYCENQLVYIIETLEKDHRVSRQKLYFIDLREEPHLFINGISHTFVSADAALDHKKFNVFKNLESDQVILWEEALQKQLMNKKTLYVFSEPKHQSDSIACIVPQYVMTPRAMVQSQHAHYIRFSVTDHEHPSPQTVDAFLKTISAIESDAWIHFQCRGGCGRTSTFILLIDILKNAKMLSLEEIIERNERIGESSNLFRHEHFKERKKKQALRRQQFIIQFYEFAKKGWGKESWCSWISKHPLS